MAKVKYLITLHVRAKNPMAPEFDAAPVPMFYARLYHHSVGDLVEKELTKEKQNDTFKAKMQEVLAKVEPEYKGDYVLSDNPVESNSQGPVWGDILPGVIWQLYEKSSLAGGRANPLGKIPYEPTFGGQTVKYFIGIRLLSYAIPRTAEIELRNDSSEAEGVHIYLFPTRTVVEEKSIRTRVRTRGGQPVGGVTVNVKKNRFIEVRWESGVPAGSKVIVGIDYFGEPPRSYDTRWIVKPELAEGWDRGLFVVDGGELKKSPFAKEPKAKDIFKSRTAAIEDQCKKVSAAECAAHKFFLDLDKKSTEPALSEKEAQAFLDLSEFLTGRTMERAAHAVSSGGMIAAPDPPDEFLKTTENAIDLLDGCLKEHFKDGAGGWSLAKVEDAFERFATGRLWLPLEGEIQHNTPYGVPNSANYLNFAELILSALDLGASNIEKIESLLRVFVRTADMFLYIYRGTDKLWDQFGFWNFSLKRQAAVNVGAVKQNYAGSDTNQLRSRFATLAYESFKLELSGNGPLPRFSGTFF